MELNRKLSFFRFYIALHSSNPSFSDYTICKKIKTKAKLNKKETIELRQNLKYYYNSIIIKWK